MIIGSHSIIYSRSPAADRAFLRDVLGFPHVDAGEGWLIFGLPPSEVAIHPSNSNDVHEFYLMCDDVTALVGKMTAKSIPCGPIQNAGWGLLTQVTLPGGGKLGIYEPRHARPKAKAAAPASNPAVKAHAALVTAKKPKLIARTEKPKLALRKAKPKTRAKAKRAR
jgi:hypothetical protein